MKTLTQITRATCLFQLQASTQGRVSEQDEKCKYACTEENYQYCERYRPIGNCNGFRYRHLRLYH